jgi:hypothetical protein
MHHLRKFTSYTFDAGEVEEGVVEADSFMEEKMPASCSFVWIIRQFVLKKVAELQTVVLPMLKGTKLRVENYIEIELLDGGKDE